MRMMFVWRRAIRLPTVMVIAASTHMSGSTTSERAAKRDEDQLEQGDEAGPLGQDGEERGDGGGRALVGVGGPRVERHRGDLEGEADDDEDDAQRDEGRRATEPVAVGQARADVRQEGAAREAVEQGHAVEHHRGGEDAHQVVLHPRLVAVQVALAPAREHVGRDRQELEGDEDRHEIARGRHHDHAEERRQQEEVVLALRRSHPRRCSWSTAARRRSPTAGTSP